MSQGPVLPEDTFVPDDAPTRLGLLVRRGDEPIAFADEGPYDSDADDFVPNDEVVSTGIDATVRQVTYRPRDGGALDAGTYHLVLVNSGESDAHLEQISVDTVAVSTIDPPDLDPDDLAPWDFPNSACGCAVPGRAPAEQAGLFRLLSLL